jgi:phosphoribosylcarboxyaminoimidazole (NCAIR) mutase
MPLGAAGALNAAIFAAEILALKNDDIRQACEKYRKELQGK